MMILKTCLNCGVEFHVYPSQSGRKYCSPACFHEHRDKELLDKAEERVKELDNECIVDCVDLSRRYAEQHYSRYANMPGVHYKIIVCLDSNGHISSVDETL